MLAGTEETLQTRSGSQNEMNAIAVALEGLIDYAGLYPPAALDMRAAVENYLAYRGQPHGFALGRFIVDASRLDELRAVAGDRVQSMPLSVLTSTEAEPQMIAHARSRGFSIESVEIKCDEPLTIARMTERLPPDLEHYFEIQLHSGCSGAIDAVASVGARAKLRMGGVVPEAFPPSKPVVNKLQLLIDRRVAFKATAGLHHPIRSRHPVTYAPDSPVALMHGFVNLLCAASMLQFGGDGHQAAAVLEEPEPDAFRATPGAIAWRDVSWSAEQLREVRKCFRSFGSCSFTEPIRDLEALGWL